MSEVHRLGATLPLGLGHVTRTRLEVEGVTFPPQCEFVSNLQFIMRDPRNFTSPETFDPGRFIGEDGRYV